MEDTEPKSEGPEEAIRRGLEHIRWVAWLEGYEEERTDRSVLPSRHPDAFAVRYEITLHPRLTGTVLFRDDPENTITVRYEVQLTPGG